MADDFQFERTQMVERQIRQRGIHDERVLNAMREIPRHLFVPPVIQEAAYRDGPLPIGHAQTISQPYIVAFMSEALALQPEDRVLEIGTGSGYQAAVLSVLVKEVYSIEIVPELAREASSRLAALGYKNVRVREGDGYKGWPEEAPFDAVMVTAAPETLPQTLVEQLKIGGRIVLPIGSGSQELMVGYKTAAGLTMEHKFPVRFVPMVKREEKARDV